jgi:transcription termination factor Rho
MAFLLTKVEVGNILKVRFESGKVGDNYKVYTATIADDEEIQTKYMKEINGNVIINNDKGFGFVDNIYIGNKQIQKYKLKNGDHFKGLAIKSFNTTKNEWTWQIK